MLERVCAAVSEIMLLTFLFLFAFLPISEGVVMPKFNIASFPAQKLANKEAKRAKNVAA